MEIKELSLTVKAEGDEGVITGYGSVFGNLDSHGDIIARGAFAESLTSRRVKMLWQHDMAEPIGTWDEVREDDRGLHMKGRIATKTTKGRDAYELVRAGALDGLSIGYVTKDYEIDNDSRILKRIDLYEVSLVTMPSNDMATITNVKASDLTERSFERLVRNMGFDRTAAKVITASGWKGYQDHLRDAGVLSPDIDQRDADDLKEQLQRILISTGVRNV